MEPWHLDDQATIYHGDCLEVLRELPDASVDSVVTDPPYGLEFMGKDWDSFRGEAWRTGAGMSKTGLGERPTQWVSYGRGDSANATCAVCGGRMRGAKQHPTSDSSPHDPEWRVKGKPLSERNNDAAQMRAFGRWCELWAAECLRVLKPGGHLLAFGGTRTWHRLAVAIEDAGFEIRDSIAWMYGSGFPKSLDVSKAIDKVNGEGGRLHKFTAWMRTTGLTARELNDATGTFMGSHYLTAKSQPAIPTPDLWALIRPLCGKVPAWVDELVERIEAEREVVGQRTAGIGTGKGTVRVMGDGTRDITAPATPAAEQWQGWGTALKPAHEPIVVARKPLIGTVAANVLEHGTGALNIDGCRIGTDAMKRTSSNGQVVSSNSAMAGPNYGRIEVGTASGRWPANVVLDEDQAAALDQQAGPRRPSAGEYTKSLSKPPTGGADPDKFLGSLVSHRSNAYANEVGGASRFFYVAKAPARERPKVDGVAHPTVKPLTLMRWLCRLVTPPGGVVLEPFAGSGTTIEAALLEGFRVVAIEREADYLPLITARLERMGQEPDGQLTLDASA